MSIEIRNVSKRFGDFQALDDVSVDVETGSLTALLGPWASGKSTLLRIIAGLEQPDTRRDRARRRGRDRRCAAEARRRLRLPALRGVQAHDGARERRVRAEDPQAAEGRDAPSASHELLELVQLAGLRRPLPGAALGRPAPADGARPRARAVEPKVLLLDEPFGALDARVRTELRVWLRRLHDETHTTTVFVTHDQEEAMEVADSVVVMNHGRIEQVAGPRELYERPRTSS